VCLYIYIYIYIYIVTSHITWELASFLTQCVLKPWWPWTYQNSIVKRVSARVVPRWVTSWEVWFKGAKSGQYCVIGDGSLQMVSKPLPNLRWESMHKPMRVASEHSLARQEWGDHMRVTSGNAGSQEGVIVTSHIAWEWGCAYMYKRIILDTTRFKVVMVMNLSNSVVKRASTRVVPWWWPLEKSDSREPKTDNIVSLGVGHYIYIYTRTN